MKKYEIFDINKGLLSDRVCAFGASPAAALKSAGYIDVIRDYTGRGNIVVYHGSRSYVYYGKDAHHA